MEFQKDFKYIASQLEESTCLKNIFKRINVCESQSLETGTCSDLQNDFVNEDLPKEGLNEEREELVKQVQEKEDRPFWRLKLVLMF